VDQFSIKHDTPTSFHLKGSSPWNDLHKMVAQTDFLRWSLEQKKAGKNPKTWQEIGKK